MSPAHLACEDNSVLIVAWVAGLLACSAYAPPVVGALDDLSYLLLELFAATCGVPSSPYVVRSGHDEEPDSSDFVNALLGWQGRVMSIRRPPTWERDHSLDWLASITNSCRNVRAEWAPVPIRFDH